MDAVKIATPSPQMEIGRSAAIIKGVKAPAPAPGGEAEGGEAAPRVAVDAQEVERAAQELASHYNLKMEVSWDDRASLLVLKVFSPDGSRLLRQFPAETVLKMAQRLRSGSDDGLLTSQV